MATILTTKIQLRNDLKTNWEATNPVLLAGEVGIELDTNRFKIGNGTDTWGNLAYAIADASGEGGTTLEQLEALEQKINEKFELYFPVAGGALTGDLVLADGSKAASEAVVDQKIAAAIVNTGTLKREVVEVLPDIADADINTIYMVKRADDTILGSANIYEEYLVVDGHFELIGDTTVDLENYLQKITSATAGNVAILNADGTLADGGLAVADVRAHVLNDIIHVTEEDRNRWNNGITEITLNGTILEVIDGQVNIPAQAVIKETDEVGFNADGGLEIKQISVTKLVDDAELVLNGGGASVAK